MSRCQPEVLCIILDARLATVEGDIGRLHPSAPEAPQGALLPPLWDALLLFCRAHAALALDQQVALWVACAKSTHLLACGFRFDIDWAAAKQRMVDALQEEGAFAGASLIAAGLSLAMCQLNRIRKTFPGHLGRVLIVDGSSKEADLSHQSNALLGCAFAAQTAGVPVDCFALGRQPASILRQVVLLAGGKHHAIPPNGREELASDVLAPALLFHFLSSSAIRKDLNTATDPQSHAVVCVCHGEPHQVAYVCSCCMSVFCSDDSAICSRCRTRFRPEADVDLKLRDIGTSALGVCP